MRAAGEGGARVAGAGGAVKASELASLKILQGRGIETDAVNVVPRSAVGGVALLCSRCPLCDGGPCDSPGSTKGLAFQRQMLQGGGLVGEGIWGVGGWTEGGMRHWGMQGDEAGAGVIHARAAARRETMRGKESRPGTTRVQTGGAGLDWATRARTRMESRMAGEAMTQPVTTTRTTRQQAERDGAGARQGTNSMTLVERNLGCGHR